MVAFARCLRSVLLLCAAGVLMVPTSRAQSPERFEVASIKPSTAGSRSDSGIQTRHGRIEARNVTLKRCIIGAYGVGPHQISGGPDWLDSDRFEISAKAENPGGDAVLMAMLQNLLADRFKLALHREKRPIAAFVLEVAKNGPKLVRAEAGQSGSNTSSTSSGVTITASRLRMDAFANVLARKMDLPVVNQTGLEGVFDFTLRWTPERAQPADGGDAPSIYTAIQEQLGLRLRQQKVPMEILVIDHAERPSAN